VFTGIVKAIGTVVSATPNKEGRLFSVRCPELVSKIEVDDSVSVNGVCQTAVSLTGDTFTFQAVEVTLTKTTLGSLKMGQPVNLELALQLSDRLGGHLVQGHVNGMATFKSVSASGNNYYLCLEADDRHFKYLVKEGSVTLNGISLTIADISLAQKRFWVSIIPHTWMNTTFNQLKTGDKINLEVDILAKYVENLLFHSDGPTNLGSKLSEEWIRSKGF
jgi:riboflavin synthase